jgi:hypothetical protein
MNTLQAIDRPTRIVHLICYPNLSPRRLGQEYSPEVLWARIDPANGIIEAVCVEQIIRFEIPADRGSHALVLQNILAGLGFYAVTSAVPSELTDETKSLVYILEWEKSVSDVTVVDKTQPPIMRLTD